MPRVRAACARLPREMAKASTIILRSSSSWAFSHGVGGSTFGSFSCAFSFLLTSDAVKHFYKKCPVQNGKKFIEELYGLMHVEYSLHVNEKDSAAMYEKFPQLRAGKLNKTLGKTQVDVFTGTLEVLRPPPTGESEMERRLNKTEKRFLAVLRDRKYQTIGIQEITLRLAFDLRYTPDFHTFYAPTDLFTFWEVKGGFEREDAAVKIKMAAARFPHWQFVKAVWEEGLWTETVVRP